MGGIEPVEASGGATGGYPGGGWGRASKRVLDTRFAWTPVGRRGLRPDAVERFRTQVADALERAGAESAALRAEIDRLHSYIRTQWAAAAANGTQPADGAPPAGAGAATSSPCSCGGEAADPGRSRTPIGQALEVIARAQAVADQRLAAAEATVAAAERRMADADRLVVTAEKRAAMAREAARNSVIEADDAIEERWTRAERETAERVAAVEELVSRRLAAVEEEARGVVERAFGQYQDILARVHRRAESAAERALEDFQDEETAELFGPAVHAELEMKAAYLKTFARASGAALRATLDVTRSELQRLRPEAEPPTEIPAYRISASGAVEELPAPAVVSVRLPAAADIPLLTIVPPPVSA